MFSLISAAMLPGMINVILKNSKGHNLFVSFFLIMISVAVTVLVFFFFFNVYGAAVMD